MSDEAKGAGRLYLVATPIGNLQDISLRALELLARVALVAAEDTRWSLKLLEAHGLRAELVSYREQNHRRAAARVLAALEAGQDVALISDAGTPGISDPGQALVAAVLERGFVVVPVPGACAAVSALAASGLPTDRFVFLGFLPRKPGPRRRLLEALLDEPGSLVIYESPRRLGQSLTDLAEVLGPRRAVVVRELTKVHETFDRGRLDELADRYADGARGEVTLVVEGGAVGRPDRTPDELGPLVEALRSGRALGAGEVADLLSALFGVERRVLYRLASRSGRAGEEPDG